MRAMLIAIAVSGALASAPSLAQKTAAGSFEDFRQKGKVVSPYVSMVPQCSVELEGNGPGGSTSAVLYVCQKKADLDVVAATVPLDPSKLMGEKQPGQRSFDHAFIYRIVRSKGQPQPVTATSPQAPQEPPQTAAPVASATGSTPTF